MESDDDEQQEECLVIDLSEECDSYDVKRLILENPSISVANGLTLNQTLIDNLRKVQAHLEQMLRKCQEKYSENEKLLIRTQENRKRNSDGTSRKKPALANPTFPYFKTLTGKFAQPNREALYRRTNNEMLPHDLKRNHKKTLWTVTDKTLLVRMVKKAALHHMAKRCPGKRFDQMKLSDLFDYPEMDNLKIDWYAVADGVMDRHSASECECLWTLYLHPSLYRGPWTEHEEDQLLEVAQKYKFQNWGEIAQQFNYKRSMFQYFLHYQTKYGIQKNLKLNERFRPDEDARILELVEKYRTGTVISWNKVASHFTTRSKQTLYYRYVFSLKPNIVRERFSVEEDIIFMAAVQEYGLNFQLIAKELPNRTIVQLRSHYNNVLKGNEMEENLWTTEKDKLLVELYEKKQTWAQIAEHIKTHDRMKCRGRYITIQKFLKKNPGAKVEDVPKRKRTNKDRITEGNWLEKVATLSGKKEQNQKRLNKTMLEINALKALISSFKLDMNILQNNSSSFTQDEYEHLKMVIASASASSESKTKNNSGAKCSAAKVDSQFDLDNFRRRFRMLYYKNRAPLPTDVVLSDPSSQDTFVIIEIVDE